MNLDLGNLDVNDIGKWPALLKAGVILILCAATLGAGFYLDTQEQLAVLAQAEQKEQQLKTELRDKQEKAASLEAYKQQMREMEESFGTMLRQLPSKNEVAELLVDITQTGLASGLEFELFQPKAEARHEFYAELPIAIKVTGDYHQFGQFVSGVASLPRIVTLHEISIAGVSARDSSRLVMNATAKTFRYLDQEELLAAANSKGKSKAKTKAKKK